MKRRSTRLVSMFAVLVALAGSLWPGSASASTGITVYSVTGVPGHVAEMTASVWSSTPLTSLTVHLFAGNQDVLDVSDFDLSSSVGGAASSVMVQNPITEAQLPLGIYYAEVDATDQGGDTLTNFSPVGYIYAFMVEPTVTMTANPTVINYDQHYVTFSGQVTGTWPDGTVQPMANQDLYLGSSNNHYYGYLATTGSDGTYSSAESIDAGGSFSATFQQTATVGMGVSNAVPIDVSSDAVGLTETVRPTIAKVDQSVTVSGMVTYDSNGTWKPLPGGEISIVDANSRTHTVVYSAADGSYSAQLPVITTGAVVVTAGRGTQLLQRTSQSVKVTVRRPTSVSPFRVSLSPLAVLTTTACVNSTAFNAQNYTPIGSVSIQFRPGLTGAWKTVHRILSQWTTDPVCPNQVASYWKASLPAPAANGYYRAVYHPGSAVWLPSVSKVVHAWKNLTKITSFSVSPTSVAKNGYVTVSGRLWKHGTSWHPYGGRKVMIVIKYKGQYLRYKHEPVTNARGWFSGRFQVYASTPWMALYRGDATHFACVSAAMDVTAAAVPAGVWRAGTDLARLPLASLVFGAQARKAGSAFR